MEKVQLHLLSPGKFSVRVSQNTGNSLTRLVRQTLLRGAITIFYKKKKAKKRERDERRFQRNFENHLDWTKKSSY